MDDSRHTFGELLRGHRQARGLTQEDLAERANLSVRAISDLERGRKTRPYPHTVHQLAEALALSSDDRETFEAAVRRTRGEGPAPPPSLPLLPTRLIGRDREVARIIQLLRDGRSRLITLTGPGGVGKTRLALEVAAVAGAHFASGVACVSLAATADASLLPATVATSLSIRVRGARSPTEALRGFLKERELLLVLDNFEHLVDAAPFVSELLATCPKLKVLVTSREPLHIRGEQQAVVEPLPVPDAGQSRTLEQTRDVPSIVLFVERAKSMRADFALTPENADVVAEICRELDGLPLALELAASRIKLFPPRALLQRLEHRLALLTDGPRDLPERQRTLRGTLDWSYALLDEADRALLTRLSVFAGGCTLEAAEAVCNGDGSLDLVQGIASLLEKSLIRRDGEEEPRLGMLETIREYVAEKLRERGEEAHVRDAHAAYFIRLAEEAEPELTGPRQAAWFRRLDAELPNIRTAVQYLHLLDRGRAEEALRLVSGLCDYFKWRTSWPEARDWLEHGLQRGGNQLSAYVRARALWTSGTLSTDESPHAAVATLQGAVSLFRAVGDRTGRIRALLSLGNAALINGQFDLATASYDEATRLSREIGYQRGITIGMANLAYIDVARGDFGAGERRLVEGLPLMHALGDSVSVSTDLSLLGSLAAVRGDLEQARARFEESLAISQEIGLEASVGVCLQGLGVVALKQERYGLAGEQLRRSLVMLRELDEQPSLLDTLDRMAALALATGDPERAGRLLGALTQLRETLKIPLAPLWRAEHERAVTETREALGEDAWRRTHSEGRTMPLEEATAYALDERDWRLCQEGGRRRLR